MEKITITARTGFWRAARDIAAGSIGPHDIAGATHRVSAVWPTKAMTAGWPTAAAPWSVEPA